MENTIDVQKATPNEVLNFDIVNQNFMQYIYENCKRNILGKNNSINYLNYKYFIYDFEAIENKLGEILLPGKLKFNGTDKLKFVTFNYEGFRWSESNIFADFANIYHQNPLSLENKQIIYDIIKEKFDEKSKELINILFSFRFLLFYLTKEIMSEKDEIRDVIYELPDYAFLSKECIEFLQHQKLKIKLEEFIDFYLFLEFLSFEPIINNLKKHLRKDIEAKSKEIILNLFKDKKFKIITKKSLGMACRKYISRYLINPREDNNDFDLVINLTRHEFWPKEFFFNKEVFFEEIEFLKNINLTNGQCYELYNLLGIDETDELKCIKIKNNKRKDIDDDSDEEEEIIDERI